MKESKPYPLLDEEDGSCLTAAEPATATSYASAFVPTQDDYPYIPGLPQTWDELVECLKEGEEEMERGESIPGDEVFKSIRERITGYAS